NKFSFLGYSLEYLISDLERILFYDIDYPWDDVKYAKRIKRLLYLYFITLLTNPKFNTDKRILYINWIKNIMDNINKYLESNNPVDLKEALISIENYLYSI